MGLVDAQGVFVKGLQAFEVLLRNFGNVGDASKSCDSFL